MTLPFLEQIFTEDAVLRILIRRRCKEADTIQKALVVDNLAVSSGRRRKFFSSRNKEIYALFPPRREWVHMGCDTKRGELTSQEKNERNLLLTVRKEAKKKGIHPEWYELLDKRIKSIIHAALTDKHIFSKPFVTVIEKKRNEKDKVIECRPICLFKTLDQRIIASLFNKAFTQLFDSYYYYNSLAFRPHKKGEPGMSHLTAVKRIKEFRKSHAGNLWVAECDMKKFYDTIDHDIIKKRFSQMLLWCKQSGTINVDERRVLRNAIHSYVNCFSFYRDVYAYNKKPNHPIWNSVKNSTGYNKQIKWIEDEFEKLFDSTEWNYRTKNHHKYQLGIPQGGAMSGLIANVIMHFIDIKLKCFWEENPDFLYIRFCDDMTMMGADERVVKEAFKRYSGKVEENHLYVHPPVAFTEKRMVSFWDGKTRPPYIWGSPGKDVFPWITFVGYDVNWMGDTRIRKSSVRKEIKKQFEKKMEIARLLTGKYGRKPQWAKQFVCNSLHKRMIGMSVGRVPIWNYRTFRNECSWAKAFTELTDNRWSRMQLRQLDRHRNKMMKHISRELSTLEYDEVKPSDKKARNDAVWYFGKPYSYFGQVLKKW